MQRCGLSIRKPQVIVQSFEVRTYPLTSLKPGSKRMVQILEHKIGVIWRGSQKGAVTFRRTHQSELKSQEGKEGSKHPYVTFKLLFNLPYGCSIGQTQLEARGLGSLLM